LTYSDALDWSVDNVPTDLYDSFDDWYDAVKQELQTPELTSSTEFENQMRDAWQQEKGTEVLEVEKELEEPEPVKEPTAQEVQHELERNLPPEQQSKGFITQEKTGALSNVLSSLPKGSKISIPQPKGAPIEIKPSVKFPSITMTRPPIPVTPTVIRPPVTVATGFRVAIVQAGKTITGGIKRGLSAIKGVFRL
jgi:hypothetical protein